MLYVRFVNGNFHRRFTLAKMTRWPIIGRLMDKALFEGDEIYILPKESSLKVRDIPLDISAPEREDLVLPSEVLRHFIERSTYRFIMNSCLCRNSEDCKDYPHDLGCIFLGKATLSIDPRLGRMASKEEAFEHLKRCEEAGLVHLIGRNKIDSVWMSVRPKEDLLTICNCCPCCCLWKVVPQLDPSISSKLKRMPGVSLSVDGERCIGCGKCVKGCYVKAITLVGGKAVIDQDLCKGCARCAHSCPEKAITLHMEDMEYIERAVKRLEPLVDVTKE